VDEADQAEAKWERGFGPSATRRGEALITLPSYNNDDPDGVEKWLTFCRTVHTLKDALRELDPAITIVFRSVSNNRPSRTKQAP
jgi:hypothetical protein